MEQIVYLKTEELKPYKGNPRRNGEAVDAVAASIKEYGFRSPIIIDKNNEVINGHTRLKAAKKLKMKEVPCIRVEDLTEEQIKAFRLIDNKTAELSDWDPDKLAEELLGLDFDLEFEFDFSDDLKKRKKWAKDKIRCDLKDKLGLKRCNDTYYHSLFKTSKTGEALEDLKKEENVPLFARTAAELIQHTLQGILIDGDWCILTTPRRRHREGFHFATEVCRLISDIIEVPFYENAFESENTRRMDPIFNMLIDPPQKNVIIYDDILTTGYTMQEVKTQLTDSGHVTFLVVSIDNH